MGNLWRSEDMSMIQIIMQRECAHDAVEELGFLGKMQFRDLNEGVNAFQRQFVDEIKRCDEMERKLRYFDEQCHKYKPEPLSDEWKVDDPSGESLDSLESSLTTFEKDLREITVRGDVLITDESRLLEMQHVLDQEHRFFSFAPEPHSDIHAVDDDDTHSESPLLEDGLYDSRMDSGTRALQFVTGLISKEKIHGFERMVYRATRGNAFLRYHELEQPVVDPQSGVEMEKDVFIVFFHGQRLRTRVSKICESYGANLYPYPAHSSQVRSVRSQVLGRLEELHSVIRQTNEQRLRILNKIAISLQAWKEHVARQKAVYHTLNMFDYSSSPKTVNAEGWIPTRLLDTVREALRRAEEKCGAEAVSIITELSVRETPPTHFETSKYTSAFQNIVQAYGVARYKEINPSVMTIVTFPFLFAVMFGDAGHGFILFLVSCFLILKEKQMEKMKLNDMVAMVFQGRYVLLLMSTFSMYVGFMYNDWFGLQMDFFGSKYTWHKEVGTEEKDKEIGHKIHDDVYPVGVDPAWYLTENKLTFYNSLKMKLSVILGVTQMIVGIILSLFNHLFHRDVLDVFVEFIPEFLFMSCTFGYMSFMVVYKWTIDWTGSGRAAPSLLQTMTDFFLSPGSVEVPLYSGQGTIQAVFLLLAFGSVPILLVVKPLILRSRHKKRMLGHQSLPDVDVEDVVLSEQNVDDEEEFVFADIMINQVIHTVEFALGAISHTASYLRLWALSLAHAELSEVFLSLVLFLSIKADPIGIFAYIGFAIWAFITIAVLLCMESLSAFLHALRLHWVEFQSKFYGGDGYMFEPFSFSKITVASYVPPTAE